MSGGPVRVQLRVLDERLRGEFGLPGYATPGSAGVDLRACLDAPLTLAPGETTLIPTGLAIHLADPGLAAMLLPRSGLGHKDGIVLGNGTGLIDEDYRGEIMVSLWHRGGEYDRAFTIAPGDRIAQAVLVPIMRPSVVEVDELGETYRGAGGFGHTGKG